MTRLFLTLYGILFLTLVVFVVALIALPDRLLHGTTQQYFDKTLSGAFRLVEEHLINQPEEKWPAVIKSLQEHFTHPLVLYPLEHAKLPPADRRRLLEGGVVLQEYGKQAQFLRRVPSSKHYLLMAFGYTAEEALAEEFRGIVHLIESRLIDRDEADWPEVLKVLIRLSDWRLKLLPLDQVDLPDKRRNQLADGKLLVEGVEEEQETFFKRIGDTTTVLRIGPFYTPWVLHHFVLLVLVIFALAMAIASYLWLLPVWRDLKRLDQSVVRFGNGDLNARLGGLKGSALLPLANTFNSMADQMQRLIRSKKELTSAVSHELRTPIARLRFGIDMLEESMDPEDRARHLTGMQGDISELEELVEELLSYARLDRENPALLFERIAMQPWFEKLIEAAKAEMGSLELTLIFTPSNEADPVDIESRLMARAVNNLLRNARRYARQRIQLSYEQNTGVCRVRVDDDGPGIPPEERERIFEPFARLNVSRDRDSGGVGLGLAIVKRIALWHGGRTWIETSQLGGACFVIEWPSKAPSGDRPISSFCSNVI